MGYFASFAPWIVFFVADLWDWRLAAVLGLVSAVAVVAEQHRRGQGLDVQVLEISTALYFAVVTVAAFTVPGASARFAPWTSGVSIAWLALTAWASIAVRRPFTLGVARQRTEPAVWSSPLFVRVNDVIAAVWAATFTLNATVMIVLQARGGDASLLFALHNVDYVVPVWFTARYPRIARERYLARRRAATPTA